MAIMPRRTAEILELLRLGFCTKTWPLPSPPAAAAHRPKFFGQGPKARSWMPWLGGTENLKGGPLWMPIGVPWSCSPVPSLRNGWNRSSDPMLCIGKTPEPEMLYCTCEIVVILLPAFEVHFSCFRLSGERRVAKARSLSDARASIGQTPARQMAVVSIIS